MKIVAVIPAYHEEERVFDAVKDAAAYVDAVVVIDDCSSDRTTEEARRAGAYVLQHVLNRGQGAALQTGMDFALQVLQAEVIVHFDADGQMQGNEIPKMIQPILDEEADVTLGSRFLGQVKNMPLMRRLVIKAAILFTYLVSGLWLSDTHNGFRALSAKAARAIHLTEDRMAHASEMLDLIATKRLKYKEIPVTIRYSAATLAKGQKSSAMFQVAKDVISGKFIK